MKRTTLAVPAVLVAIVALVVVAGAPAKKPALSATPVFKLNLKPSQEVPPIKGLKASARGNVTFDLERSSAGAITSGEVIFYFNYSFPAAVTLSGLHIHQGAKGAIGDVVVSSGLGSLADADGQGNVTFVVTGASPATLQAILDNPRAYYVNLHTTVPAHPGGALREQMRNPTKG